ncbi:cell wall assembly and cell proliferation coordinating protein [Rhodopirellula maiorica SM1]|uniref:Cell wall assembly and cell proliferation coordinating protein n=2 Tax=Novipirellula TaxID=2795426 RepID=M5RBF4_9BACT|nr:cell wall assembly and cell proliferation coordinating protein [Rhodopirellula maiorica SM1]
MSLTENIALVRLNLETYAEGYHRMSVASEDGGAGVPADMFEGDVDDEGWVAWRMLPSTLSESDVSQMETEFAIQLPPLFRAYLLAGFQLFDQIHSSRYDQLIFNTDVPSNNPLGPIRQLINVWKPLLSANFIPFAQWGDGWGPMCFDAANRTADGDCPIVWMDHELLAPLGPDKCADRDSVMPHANPLYDSYRDFFSDVFSQA